MTIHGSNDNEPRRYLIGAGNVTWETPVVPRMTSDEVETLSRPLRELFSWVCEARDATKKDGDYAAVYVVSDIYGISSKIGRAADPVLRLAQLQTGNPNRLFIHRLFWMRGLTAQTSDVVDYAEKKSHASASKRFTRQEGEWFLCSPSEAHDVIEEEVGLLRASGHIGRYCVMTPPCALWKAAA